MFIGIDIGGTFLKGAVFPRDSRVPLKIVRLVGVEPSLTSEGRAEIDPRRLIGQARELCRRLQSEAREVDGIFITGQMHGLCVTTSDLTPVIPIVTWRDRLPIHIKGSKLSQADYLREKLSTPQLMSIGNEIRDGIPSVSLVSREDEIAAYRDLVPHSLLSYTAHVLADMRSTRPIMHVTDAAAHGLYDLNERTWSNEVISTLGLAKYLWPEVSETVVPIGQSSEFGCPVFTAVGDQQAALLGNKLRDEEMSLNIATGSQVSRITTELIDWCQTRPYFDGKRIATVTHIPAGRALNALVALFVGNGTQSTDMFWEQIEQELAADSRTDLEMDISFFPSATGITGSIRNIREDNLTARSIFAAALNSMVETFSEFALRLDPTDQLRTISLTGGLASRFAALRRALDAQFPRHVIRESVSEDASLEGLRILAGSVNL